VRNKLRAYLAEFAQANKELEDRPETL